MGKRSRKDLGVEEESMNGSGGAQKLTLVDDKAVDPSLALLFSNSVSSALSLLLLSWT